MSVGGRITLINLVLNAIPMYYLSFYKHLKVVIAEMIKLQQKFLWGGGVDKRCISWVNWEEVCRDKDIGDLGLEA